MAKSRGLWSLIRGLSGSKKATLRELALSAQARETLIEDPEWDVLYPESFTFTAPHLALIKLARLHWSRTENGAPELDPQNPYRDASTMEHLTLLLGEDRSEATQIAFLQSMVAAIAQFCATAQIAPGKYTLSSPPDGVAPQVTLTPDLITLVRNLAWDWPDEDDMRDAQSAGEIAGPVVDPKRPYGDMSFYQLDIHRLLEWPIEHRNEDGFIQLSDSQIEAATLLHTQILGAAQAVLEHGEVDSPNV